MEGLGFFIWNLRDMPADPGTLLSVLQPMGVKWLSLKVAEGQKPYNQITKYGDSSTNDAYLKMYIGELQEAGIKVRGWHWPYVATPGACGDRAEERREKLGLDGYDLDIEGEWADKKTYGRAKAAEILLSKLHGGNFEISLCSYRYPTNFPDVPWGKFVGSEKVDIMMPQVYWLQAHNPAEQIERSMLEYRALTDKPFVPLGATFGVGKVGGSGFWETTSDDIKEFVATCKRLKFPAYGFYSLDWLYKNNRHDWITAITGVPSGGGEEEPPVEDTTYTEFRILADSLNVRLEPRVGSRVLKTVKKGAIVSATSVLGTDAWIQLPDGGWVCVKMGSSRFAEPV